jgi:hypothetical protein
VRLLVAAPEIKGPSAVDLHCLMMVCGRMRVPPSISTLVGPREHPSSSQRGEPACHFLKSQLALAWQITFAPSARTNPVRRSSLRGSGWKFEGSTPMQNSLPMNRSKRCGARTRSGKPCQSPAMPNGRCRMHGGLSPGPPKGNKDGFKHGRYCAEGNRPPRPRRFTPNQSRHSLKVGVSYAQMQNRD